MTRPQASVVILLLILAGLLWLAPEVPLLGFAGVLLAIALHAAAEPMMRRLRLPEPAAVLLAAALVLLVLGLGIWAASGPMAAEIAQLTEELPRSLAQLRARVQGLPWGPRLLEQFNPGQALAGAGGSVASAASGTLGALGNVLLVVLLAVYLAVQPAPYLKGLVLLVAPPLRAEARETLAEIFRVLRGWLLGQAFAMVVTGCFTFLGLWALGVPLAGPLAAIAALLGFIPVIGPVIAAVPAILLALSQDPWLALWVAALFLTTQTIEGNILTPMVQSSLSDLPPAALILMQVLAGALFGLLGVALSAPALAVLLVLVRRGYVKNWLEGGGSFRLE